jgi:hypothetical protein
MFRLRWLCRFSRKSCRPRRILTRSFNFRNPEDPLIKPCHIPLDHLVLATTKHSGVLMFAAYVTVTILASIFTGIAAVTYLIGHDYPKAQLTMKRLPLSWMPRLGTVLAAGSLGLLAGFGVPLIGTAAAAGLVLYFIGALVAHLRVGSRKLVGWAVFFVTVVATLVVNVTYHW